jgi:hypothetical protein
MDHFLYYITKTSLLYYERHVAARGLLNDLASLYSVLPTSAEYNAEHNKEVVRLS